MFFATCISVFSPALAQYDESGTAVEAPAVPADVPKDVVDSATGEVVTVPPKQVIVETEVPAEVSNESFFASVSNAIGQMKGATTLGIVAILVQLIIQFLKTSYANHIFRKVSGEAKLSIVLGLTVVGTVIPLVGQGMEWAAALTSGAALSATMVFFNQIWKQFFKQA